MGVQSEGPSKISKIRSDLEILKKRKKELEDKEEELFKSSHTPKTTVKKSSKKESPVKKSSTKTITGDKMFDPESLVLTKDDVVHFCDRILEKWNKDPSKNLKQIFAMNAVRTSVFWTDDDSLKAIWKEILLWMYDLLYENAKAHGNESDYNWTKTLSKIKK